jgi:hypothetical protein
MFKFLEKPTPADEVVYGQTRPSLYKVSRVTRKVLDQLTFNPDGIERQRQDNTNLAHLDASHKVSRLANFLIDQGLLDADNGLVASRMTARGTSVECYAQHDPDTVKQSGIRALLRIVNQYSGLNTLYYAKIQESLPDSSHSYTLDTIEMVNPDNGQCFGPEDYDNQELQDLYYNFADAVYDFSPVVVSHERQLKVQSY